ncbi:5-formyltetrahydrofolate cyclo-ligase [Helicobacter didelphidarum]|uniref:5-formyltetrahydrofolate cyclo-ligase n=1 Tax=Helicobacter didelphidarum TaxID=2040648 RepID=UPI001FE38746|nr:5-formyltetrahydrofolate cyclo-ligase [Helicobacter didelphidarum]
MNLQTKVEFRAFLKSKMSKKYCIRDILCAKEIFSFIQNYKPPKSYKIYQKNGLYYIQNKRYYCNILLYSPLQSEVNIHYVTKMLMKNKNYQVFIPKVEINNLKIVKYRLPLLKNYFNIKEPASSKKYQDIILNVAVVPVLGVDKNFKRIGFGKGMYDRFYTSLKVKPYNIFVSRFSRIATTSLCDWHDIQADIYMSVYQ